MPTKQGYTLFETRIGPCGLAWTARGIDQVQLPEKDAIQTEGRLSHRAGGRKRADSLPQSIMEVVTRIKHHLAGKPDLMQNVKLDLTGLTEFTGKVLGILRRVPPGSVTTYGELAQKAGRPNASRAVGRAMATNPVPLIVPCHRVLTSTGQLGGFSAADGIRLKARLLHAEGHVLNQEHARGIAVLSKADPVMGRIIDRIGPYLAVCGPAGDPYESLIKSIIYQQLALKAAATIGERFRHMTLGDNFPRPEQVLTFSDAQLRSVGLSRQKSSYLRDLAGRIHRGDVRLANLGRLDDEQVIETLTRIKGIGRWSAQMFLIFHLGRLDVLPVDDLGFQRGVQTAYGLKQRPGPADLIKFGDRWKPYRSMATWYFWQYLGAGGQ